MLYVGSYPGAHGEPRFKLPPNVVGLHRVFCQDAALAPLDGAGRAALREQIRSLRVAIDARPEPSRACWRAWSACTSRARPARTSWRRSPANDLTLPELLHGRSSFQLLTTIAERVAPDAPFLDLFWHYRAIFAPVLRLLAAPTVAARCYHAVSTGYAGLLAALWSHRTGRPLMVTEHGIYARERDMELARADWIRDEAGGVSEPRSTWAPRISPLRRLWSSFFRALSRIAYVQARHIITLSDVNRSKQIADGAPPREDRDRAQRRRPAARPRSRQRTRDATATTWSRRRRGACASGSSGGWCRSRTRHLRARVRHRARGRRRRGRASSAPPTRIRAMPRAAGSWWRGSGARATSSSSGRCRRRRSTATWTSWS